MGSLTYLDTATGQWVTTEDAQQSGGGGVQLTDGSVITPYIADGAVTDPKIVSMDAAKLTGAIDAARILPGTLPANTIIGTFDSSYLDPSFVDQVNSNTTNLNLKSKVYYQDTPPTGGSYSVGDTWFDTAHGNAVMVWNGGAWVSAQDSSIVTAQKSADAANTLASTKNTVYTQAAMPTGGTYKVGDTWFDTDNGNQISTWDGTKWVPTLFNSNALDPSVNTSISNAQDSANRALSAANSKNTIYYSTTQPSGGTYLKGDTWFDTDDGMHMYVFDGTVWKDATDTRLLSTMGSAHVFYQATQPTGAVYLKGDLWFDTANNYKQYTYSGTGWQLTQDSNTALGQANLALQSADGKNKIIYSTSPASGTTGYKAGDTWYQTSANGVIGYWQFNGTAWTSMVLQNAVFGNIDAGKITTGYLSAAIIAAKSITGDKIAANTITASNIATGTITADSGVIANAAITNAMIANLAVDDAKIANLDGGKIVADSITSTQIKAASILGDDIAGQTITGNNIKAGSITAANAVFADAAIVSANISDAAITTAKIADLAVGTAQIANLAVTNEKVISLDAQKINTGFLAAARIAAGSITATKLTLGRATNLMPDPEFVNLDAWWGASNIRQVAGTGMNGGYGVVVPAVNEQRGVYTAGTKDFAIPTVVGDSYIVSFWYKSTVWISGGDISLYVKGYNADFSTSGFYPSAPAATSPPGDIAPNVWYQMSATITAQQDLQNLQIGMYAEAAHSGEVTFSDPVVRPMISGQLIVNGSITGDQLAANSITAESGIIKSIDASKITTGTINASLIETIPVDKVSGTLPANQLPSDLGSTLNISANTSITQKADASALDPINNSITNLNNSVTNLTNSVKIDSAGILISQNNSTAGAKQFAIQIDGDSMDFLENGQAVAVLTGQRMTIQNATVSGEIIVGGHSITRSGEQTVFRWNG